jgi:hypothetical protein
MKPCSKPSKDVLVSDHKIVATVRGRGKSLDWIPKIVYRLESDGEPGFVAGID